MSLSIDEKSRKEEDTTVLEPPAVNVKLSNLQEAAPNEASLSHDHEATRLTEVPDASAMTNTPGSPQWPEAPEPDNIEAPEMSFKDRILSRYRIIGPPLPQDRGDGGASDSQKTEIEDWKNNPPLAQDLRASRRPADPSEPRLNQRTGQTKTGPPLGDFIVKAVVDPVLYLFAKLANIERFGKFMSSRGNEYFCDIDEDYLTDRFNLTGLNAEVENYQDAIDLINDVFDADCGDDEREQIEKSARHLYGLIHARYITTTRGLQKMVSPLSLSHSPPISRLAPQGFFSVFSPSDL